MQSDDESTYSVTDGGTDDETECDDGVCQSPHEDTWDVDWMLDMVVHSLIDVQSVRDLQAFHIPELVTCILSPYILERTVRRGEYRGVSRIRSTSSWQVQMFHNGKLTRLATVSDMFVGALIRAAALLDDRLRDQRRMNEWFLCMVRDPSSMQEWHSHILLAQIEDES